MGVSELNFDGLVGPTHHYAGLSFGNTASTRFANTTANPKAAALQGIQKMRLLLNLGIPQAIFPLTSARISAYSDNWALPGQWRKCYKKQKNRPQNYSALVFLPPACGQQMQRRFPPVPIQKIGAYTSPPPISSPIFTATRRRRFLIHSCNIFLRTHPISWCTALSPQHY